MNAETARSGRQAMTAAGVLYGPVYRIPPDIATILQAREVPVEGGIPRTEINPAVVRKFEQTFHFGATQVGEGGSLLFMNNDSPFDRGVVFHFGIQYYAPNVISSFFPFPVMHPVTGHPVTWEHYYDGLMDHVFCAIRSVVVPAHLKEAVSTELTMKKKCAAPDISLRVRKYLFGPGSPLAEPAPRRPPAGPAAAGAPQGGRKKTRKLRRKSKKTLRRR